MTNEIKKENWKEFFDQLSREKLGWETVVQVLADETGAQVLDRGLPLVGLIFEETPTGSRIELIIGSGVGNHHTHTINDPKYIAFEGPGERSEGTLDIEDESGTKTLIRFSQTLPAVVTYSETEVISTVSNGT
ncbi:MAG: DUF5335 family protein [Pyrinomonadaceae bacterium]